MYRLIIKTIFILIVTISSPVCGNETVAVLESIVEDPIPMAAKHVIADIISEIIVISEQYRVVDRTAIQKLLEEQNFQLSGAVSDREIADVGKIMGADFVIVTTASRLGQRYFLSAKMIDVETGQIELQQSQELSGDDEVLFDLAAIVGQRLTGLDIEVYVTRKGKVKAGKPETVGSSIGGAIGYNIKMGDAADRSEAGAFVIVEYLYQFSSRFGLGGWAGVGPFSWLDQETGEVDRQYFVPLIGLKLLLLDKVKGFAASLDIGLLPGVTLYFRNFLLQIHYHPWSQSGNFVTAGSIGIGAGYSYVISR